MLTKKKSGPFRESQFTATESSSAEEKAKFANHFILFLEKGMPTHLFVNWFYKRLSMTFGHIAHYNINGFWSEFFLNEWHRLGFLQKTMTHRPAGGPEYTYSDVEKAIQEYLHKEQTLLTRYAEAYRNAVLNRDMEILGELIKKHPAIARERLEACERELAAAKP